MLIAASVALSASAATAQRVEFPSTVGGYGGYGGYGTTAPAAPSFDPYATPGMAAPPADLPYAPSIAPYSNTGPYGNAAPYNYGAPPATTPYGAQPGFAAPPPPSSSWSTGDFPLGWQGGSYVYQNPDGSQARLQRLLQEISVEHTWLAGEHAANELEIHRTELAATFGIPIFYNPDTPLLITPGFAFNWFEGPVDPVADLPPRVYDAYLDAAWAPALGERLSLDLGVRTGVWTDFNVVNSDSIRILGRGLGKFALSPRMDILAGVWYLDRNHIKLLPAGGVHWRPNTNWDAYIVFPNPKVRRRFVDVTSSKWWWYVAGEYGGGRWTIERADGSPDDFDYNDIRVITGLEWETQTQARGYIEAGYVFNRELVYARSLTPPFVTLDETVMVRVGFDF
ncbi:MAG: hypothetical protein CMJ58_09980 [Planctomycetaceae bacterium]|nr:hypothetical protein [Planctomycetaceae bacterium]